MFLEACGATGSLRFQWSDPTTAEVCSREIERAAFVVGRHPAADLALDDPSVEPYHAFFQVVEGRLFAFDLGTTEGLRWGEVPRAAGWVSRGQTLKIGRYAIRLVGGDQDEPKSVAQPAPTTVRYVSRLNLPGVFLEYRVATEGKDVRYQREVLDRALMLAGSSDRCKLRVAGPDVPKFICPLVRTPAGLWMTNIHPSEGATVNGAFCRFTRLEDEDVVQLGQLESSSHLRRSPPLPTTVQVADFPASVNTRPAGQPRAHRRVATPVDETSPVSLMQPLLEMAGSELDPQSSPFGQALVLMVRLLGDVHRDHLTLVRDELAAIRRLSEDMDKLRGEARQPDPRQLSSAGDQFSNGTSNSGDDDAPLEEAPRPHPEAVSEIIAERLDAWERERQSRWRKLLKLLVPS